MWDIPAESSVSAGCLIFTSRLCTGTSTIHVFFLFRPGFATSNNAIDYASAIKQVSKRSKNKQSRIAKRWIIKPKDYPLGMKYHIPSTSLGNSHKFGTVFRLGNKRTQDEVYTRRRAIVHTLIILLLFFRHRSQEE